MEINEELEILKKALVTHQTIFSDIHIRLIKIEQRLNIETGVPNSNEHYFYSKDEKGCWLIKCAKTGGSFSTALWRNEVVQKQKCPCCGLTVIRRKD